MMQWKPKGWMLVHVLLLALPGLVTMCNTVVVPVMAQGTVATTTVTDTVYRADGSVASGTVLVSWSAFTTASGLTVPAGSTSVAIGTGGALSIALAPNAGSTPMGSYYTAVYHLDDGSVSREYWVVPVSSGAVALSTIRSTVLPASVAMQTVSKAYVDTAIAAAVTGQPLDSSTPYVLKAGDAMTGPLVLPGDPTASTQAADKHYVDTNVTAVASGLAQKVSTLPVATQTVIQPVGTQLQVNHLNGSEYASQYVTGTGNNGIANAVASADCVGGCDVKADTSYSSSEIYSPQTWNSSATAGTHVEDTRGGSKRDSYMNPVSVASPGNNAGQALDVVSTQNAASMFQQTGSEVSGSFGLVITHEALTGGSNLFPATEENVPYFKTGYSALLVNGTYNAQGQHVLAPNAINCYGVGDCLIGSQYLTTSGGFRDEADEGGHPFDLQILEDSRVFDGICSSGCTTGATQITVTPTSAPGTQGDGRFLIDMNPARVLTTGTLTGGGPGLPSANATFSGTSFPVSILLTTAQAVLSQANNVAPGTVSVSIATSGVPSGFVTNTGAIPAPSGVACLADQPSGFLPQNYEMANYTVVDGSHLRLTLNKVHAAGTIIAVGGLCGYGLEQTVDTREGIRQVFPVIGSYSATGLYYAGGATPIVGVSGLTSAYLNVSLPIAAIARTSNVVTITTAGNLPADVSGLTLTVAGVTDTSYNGSFVVTTTGPNTLTYTAAGANSTSTGGTLSVITGGFALYPMAEVLSVYNATTKNIDGQMTLAPNLVSWATNDLVEQPHYFQEAVNGDVEFIRQTTPRPTIYTRAGLQYQDNVSVGLRGWSIANAAPASNYLGNGGTHHAPDWAYEATGIWNRTFDVQAGEESVFAVHCNSHGCGKWNSGYNLFLLDSNVGLDVMGYQPTTSTLNLNLRGTGYSFSPLGFTAGTINAGTLNVNAVNATTLSGSVSAAQLPVFGGSGSGHAKGAVPDPGATPGATRYLREDGTWTVPAGGAGTGGSSGVVLTGGAEADYNFMQGSGSVLSDISGSGNDGTLASGASPTWTTTGLVFSGQQHVDLPAVLNNAQTILMSVYVNPVPTSAAAIPGNTFPVLLSSTMAGVQGVNLMYGAQLGSQTVSAAPGMYAPAIFTRGSHSTQSSNLLSGFHTLAFVLGTGSGNLDHLYIDGQEVTQYGLQGSTYGAQSSGHFVIGGFASSDFFSGSGCNCTMYRMRFHAMQLTADQIASDSAKMNYEVSSRGVAVTPIPLNAGVSRLFAIGDSITNGTAAGGVTPWENLMTLSTLSPGVVNAGIGGITVAAIGGSEAVRIAPQCPSTTGPSIAVVFAGTNDFFYPYAPGDVFGALTGEIQTLKRAGCRVFVGTMLSRSGNSNNGAGAAFDVQKDAYDALILANATQSGADGIIDFAAEPLIGADGASANTGYFLGDGIHPLQTMQNRMGGIASNSLNYYFSSYSVSNPHVVTAAGYTMLSSDRAVTAAPTASAAYTLPDCTGPSGESYTISNPQSAYALTIRGQSGQPINGLSTAITVPANSTVTLRDVANPKTVSGCHWAM